MYRLIKEIIHDDLRKNDYRIQSSAIQAIQEAAEHYITGVFSDAQLCAAHAHRAGVTPKDVELTLCLRDPTLNRANLGVQTYWGYSKAQLDSTYY